MYARQQAALAELSQSALAGTDLPTLMSQAVTLVAHTLDVDYSAILELLPDRSALVLRAGVGWQEGSVGCATVGCGTASPAGYALLRNTPVIVEDWRSETRFRQPPLLRSHGVISSLRVIIHTPDRPFGVLGADSKVRRTFTSDELHFLQAVANVLAMAIERLRANQTLEQRVEERTRELERRHQVAESLHEILTILNSNRTLDETLDYIIAQACRLLDTSAGAIYRLHRQEAILNIQAAWGMDTDDAALNLPIGWGATGRAVLQRQPVKIKDTLAALQDQSDPLLAPQPEARLTHLAIRYRALLAVPLIVKADVYGAITLYCNEPREFSDEEVELAAALSDQAALAIENARLVAAAQGKAVVEERQRLARDLHDSVTQALYAVTLHAEAATRLLSSQDVATAVHYLRKLQDIAQEALEEMRLLIFELRPPILDQEGLVAALQARLEAVEGRANLQTKFTVEGVSRLSPRIEQALYRIAQEALNNALKHARARNLTMSLRQEPHTVILEITDDGLGFDPASAREQGGLGLRGIEERVAQLGGRVTLQSAPGAGTQVCVELSV
ncbi:MAG: GAF domain-containing sensor histidine kinase [Chloroflexota bacterium]|nr:GAF domain-containing sensor histidine kinase [Chloroflexota bacterium]